MKAVVSGKWLVASLVRVRFPAGADLSIQSALSSDASWIVSGHGFSRAGERLRRHSPCARQALQLWLKPCRARKQGVPPEGGTAEAVP
jgi:hypothetical protein